MACYKPLQGYRSVSTTAAGKRKLVFSPKDGYVDLPVTVPCGQCIGCRLERSRQWGLRISHEASLHPFNMFVTLSYDDEHLPEGGTLVKRHFQLFMKRVRKQFGESIRYFHCGEYGDTTQRPHYHAIIFNLDMPDKRVIKQDPRGYNLYTSEQLTKLWGLGHVWIGNVTNESANYVARYIMKKVTGELAADHYGDRLPEYVTMSRRPGIATGWIEKFHKDVYPSDSCIVAGKQQKPPKFYDKAHEALDPVAHQRVKNARARFGKIHEADSTPERLAVREEVRAAKTSKLTRNSL